MSTKKNKILYIEHENFIEGIMPDSKSFYFDKEFKEIVQNNCWHYTDGYMYSTKLGLMHKLFLKTRNGYETDHINRNRLDNRKENLREVTRQENMKNKSMYKSNSSGHKGVKWNKNLNKWQVQITVDKKRIHLGVFEDIQSAIFARKQAELKM